MAFVCNIPIGFSTVSRGLDGGAGRIDLDLADELMRPQEHPPFPGRSLYGETD
jgi:hypothetical protein